MVDFRKWLVALAAVGLFLGIGSSAANAAGTITCNTANAVNNNVRAEGVAELLGDLVLNCTGGTTTTAGAAIPLENITLSINTNITSRLVGPPLSNISEAVMTIDEPFPAAGGGNPPAPVGPTPTAANAQTQLACLANNNTNCVIISKGLGIGTPGNYDGTAGHFNVFQGVQTGANAITWTGVPVDAPGTGGGTRIIRFTNIRGNAFQLGVSSTLVSTTISAILSVNGSATLSINQGNGSVIGTVIPGILQPPHIQRLALESQTPYAPGPALYQQCNSVNTYLLTPPGLVTTDNGIAISVTEGFAYSFKPQNYGQIYNVVTLAQASYTPPGTFYAENIPGFNYDSESGFAPLTGIGLTEPSGGTEAVGFADHGTQLQFTVSGVSAGVSLYAPSWVYLSGNYGVGTKAGVAVLVGQSGGISGIGTSTSIPVVAGATSYASAGPLIPVGVSGTSGSLTYEIYYSDPSVTETMTVPISVEYVSNTGSNIPAPTSSPTTIGVEFSPQSTSSVATSGPVPRFGPSGSPASLFSISPCSCNLLFPFVTNIAGFDTGVAIANTSTDPFGTSPQTGTVTLNYYGTTSGGGAAPPKAVSSAVAGGQELIFTVSNGGNFGIPATPGFEGYIIAQANFQFCHGFAFISDVGAQKLAEGYLAIQLDVPGLNRTFNVGENEGH
ncbi:MAG: hypothetical protein ABSG13_00135 [Bryobacteraceae bacterium]